MDLVSTRIITADVARLVRFYERITGVGASWSTPDFAELRTPRATLAIAGTATVPLFAPGSAEPGANRSVIVEFLADDVDAMHRELTTDPSPDLPVEVVAGPTTMPWGNRSLLLRDPDGSLVNLFTPVTDDAAQRVGR
jgi:catechol 2,3-dioxygenase-like lactoylglutathione lyase family enzyme